MRGEVWVSGSISTVFHGAPATSALGVRPHQVAAGLFDQMPEVGVALHLILDLPNRVNHGGVIPATEEVAEVETEEPDEEEETEEEEEVKEPMMYVIRTLRGTHAGNVPVAVWEP